MPDIFYDKLDAVPEGLKDYAVQDGARFIVKVAPQKKFEEFRDNNIGLLKDKDALAARINSYSQLVGEDTAKAAAELTELRAMAQNVNMEADIRPSGRQRCSLGTSERGRASGGRHGCAKSPGRS